MYKFYKSKTKLYIPYAMQWH